MFDSFSLSAATDLSLWERIAEWYQGSLIHELLNYFQERFFTVDFGLYENFSISPSTAKTIASIIPALAIALVVASFMTARLRVNMGRFVRRLLKKECFSPESAKTLMELDMFRNASLRRELSRGSSLRMVVRCLHADGTDTGVGAYQEMPLSKMLEGVLEEEDKTDGEASEAVTEAAAADEAAGENGTLTVEKSDPETAPVTDEIADTVSASAQGQALVSDAENAHTVSKNTHTVSKKARYAAKKVDFLTARFYIPEPLKHRADVRFDSRGSSWAPAIASIVIVTVLSALLCWLLPYILWLADSIISLMAPK